MRGGRGPREGARLAQAAGPGVRGSAAGRGRWRTAPARAHQDVERALRALLVLLDGGEHRQHQAGEDQQEPAAGGGVRGGAGRREAGPKGRAGPVGSGAGPRLRPPPLPPESFLL